jgi:hypothetical protein
MQLTIDATTEELEELAKMAYVAQFVFDSSGRVSKNYKYPCMAVFDQALRKLNKALLPLIPNAGLLEVDEKSDMVFTHTIEMEVHCNKIVEQFSRDTYLNSVCSELTRRDYREKTGHPSPGVIFPGDVYSILYDNNMEELKQNGLKRLRIVE